MNKIDERILRLIEFLIFQKRVTSIRDFCNEIKMREQTVSKIKRGTNSFTVSQIETICFCFSINPGWIFGFSETIFVERPPDKTEKTAEIIVNEQNRFFI